MASGALTTTSLRSNSFSAQLVHWHRALQPDLLTGHDAKNIQDNPFACVLGWRRQSNVLEQNLVLCAHEQGVDQAQIMPLRKWRSDVMVPNLRRPQDVMALLNLQTVVLLLFSMNSQPRVIVGLGAASSPYTLRGPRKHPRRSKHV